MSRSCVLFDLFNTLIVPGPATPEQGSSAGAESGAGLLVDLFGEIGAAISDEEASTLERTVRHYAPAPADGDATRFERRLTAYLSDRHDLRVAPHNLRRIANAVCASWGDSMIVDTGVEATLAELSERFALGIVSNFDQYPYLRGLLERTGLSSRVDAVVISGEEGVEKPDPEIVYRACARVDCSPQAAAFVGDSVADYGAAAAAGTRFFWIRRAGDYTSDTEHFRSSDAELTERARQGEIVLLTSISGLLDYL